MIAESADHEAPAPTEAIVDRAVTIAETAVRGGHAPPVDRSSEMLLGVARGDLTLPSTREAVDERRASFECLPNARWLSLETEEVAPMLTLARLMSRARASRPRAGGSEELLTESQVRAFVAEQRSPVEWRVTVAIVSWLSDVPRERAKPSSPSPSPPAPGRADATSIGTPPTLGQWVRLGAEVGRATVSRYAAKLRALRATRREK